MTPTDRKNLTMLACSTEDKGFAGRSTPTTTLADLENPEHVGVPRRKTKVFAGMSTPTMTLADLENSEHVGAPRRKTKVLREVDANNDAC